MFSVDQIDTFIKSMRTRYGKLKQDKAKSRRRHVVGPQRVDLGQLHLPQPPHQRDEEEEANFVQG